MNKDQIKEADQWFDKMNRRINRMLRAMYIVGGLAVAALLVYIFISESMYVKFSFYGFTGAALLLNAFIQTANARVQIRNYKAVRRAYERYNSLYGSDTVPSQHQESDANNKPKERPPLSWFARLWNRVFLQ